MRTIIAGAIVPLLSAPMSVLGVLATYARKAVSARNGVRHLVSVEDSQMYREPGFRELSVVRSVDSVQFCLGESVGLSHEQEQLLHGFVHAAVRAAKDFAQAVQPSDTAGDGLSRNSLLSEEVSRRIAIAEAQVAALRAVEPSATAFFDSLTSEQQALLVKHRAAY